MSISLTEIFTGLIGVFLTWAATQLYQKWKPFVKWAKRISAVSDRVDVVETKIDILTKRQFALIDVDNRPIFIMDEKNKVKKVNLAWLEMTEMTDEDSALGLGYLQAIPEEDRAFMKEQRENFLSSPSFFSGEVRFKKVKSKTIIIAHCKSKPILNGEILVEVIGILEEKKINL